MIYWRKKEKAYITDPEAGLLTIRGPMIMVVDDTYYLTSTQSPYRQGENTGMHLWSSKDMRLFRITASSSAGRIYRKIAVNGCTSVRRSTNLTEQSNLNNH